MRSKEKDLQGFHKRGIGRGIIPRGWKTKAEEDSLIKNNNIRKDIKDNARNFCGGCKHFTITRNGLSKEGGCDY